MQTLRTVFYSVVTRVFVCVCVCVCARARVSFFLPFRPSPSRSVGLSCLRKKYEIPSVIESTIICWEG